VLLASTVGDIPGDELGELLGEPLRGDEEPHWASLSAWRELGATLGEEPPELGE
jgi:hypothetical protein